MRTVVTSPSPRRDHRALLRRRFSTANILVAVMLFAGICVVLYPTAANWFSDRAHTAEVSGYAQSVSERGTSDLQEALASARGYNEQLPNGPLRDPYLLNEDGLPQSVEDGWEDYVAQLSMQPDAPIARIRVPDIGVDLPIYHGTDDATLERGIGHLYGSALPVGGAGTHSVLTGHSGLPAASLFTHLEDLALGDVFAIDVLGETLLYEVDQIETVEPDQGDELRRVAGKDYVTLLTCTPTGSNTHRLLVRGERIDAVSADADITRLSANDTDPGVPWWILGLVAGAGASLFVGSRRVSREDGPSPSH